MLTLSLYQIGSKFKCLVCRKELVYLEVLVYFGWINRFLFLTLLKRPVPVMWCFARLASWVVASQADTLWYMCLRATFAKRKRRWGKSSWGGSSKWRNDMIENISGFETVTFSRLWYTLKPLISPWLIHIVLFVTIGPERMRWCKCSLSGNKKNHKGHRCKCDVCRCLVILSTLVYPNAIILLFKDESVFSNVSDDISHVFEQLSNYSAHLNLWIRSSCLNFFLTLHSFPTLKL